MVDVLFNRYFVISRHLFLRNALVDIRIAIFAVLLHDPNVLDYRSTRMRSLSELVPNERQTLREAMS